MLRPEMDDLLRATAVITILEAEVVTLQRQLAKAQENVEYRQGIADERDHALCYMRDALQRRGVSRFEINSIMMSGEDGR